MSILKLSNFCGVIFVVGIVYTIILIFSSLASLPSSEKREYFKDWQAFSSSGSHGVSFIQPNPGCDSVNLFVKNKTSESKNIIYKKPKKSFKLISKNKKTKVQYIDTLIEESIPDFYPDSASFESGDTIPNG